MLKVIVHIQWITTVAMYSNYSGVDPGGRGALWGLKPPPFIFRLYLINMLSIIMKFCLSIIVTGFWKNDPNRTLEVSR